MKWTRICRSKNKGGPGVKDIHKENISLLTRCGGSWRSTKDFGKVLPWPNILRGLLWPL